MQALKLEGTNGFNHRIIFDYEGQPDWAALGFDSRQPQYYFGVNPDTKQQLQILVIDDITKVNDNLATWQSNANHWSIGATLTVIDEATMISDKQAFIDAMPATE